MKDKTKGRRHSQLSLQKMYHPPNFSLEILLTSLESATFVAQFNTLYTYTTMMKTDSPVRAHSEMSNDEGYKAFTKDKRTRTTRSNNDAIFSSARREGGEGEHF